MATDNNRPDYRDTVFLPKTAFPMKAGLPQKEPQILSQWQAQELYAQVRAARDGAPKFILHDGPPYANGDMHIGHALNHILKDMVVRTQTLLGKDAPYVPGWDCHGLPIEWKVEEQYRKKKRNKDEVPAAEFRAECRAYAQHWVDVQREQLKRLGIGGNWDKPYLTMDPDAEATIVSELMKFAASGQLYRGAKPVMWSPVEKTALAEAEIEYEDVTSTQIDVAFEIVEAPNCPLISELLGKDPSRPVRAVVWTTTPWTIPVNQAIAFADDEEYVLAGAYRKSVPAIDYPESQRLPTVEDGFPPQPSMAFQLGYLVVAKDLVPALQARMSEYFGAAQIAIPLGAFFGRELRGAVTRHPMHHLGGFFAAPRPLIPGHHVTTDAGTGLVHMAPDHGEEDFEVCKAHGINPVFAVEGDGKYRADWPWLGGQGSVINTKFNAPDGPICADLRETGALLSAGDFRHSYPHSWRSKARVIYRCTPQWFVPMDQAQDGGTLREKALSELDRVRFFPEKGRNRIGSMVADRPDWVLSRQRAWGVPITLFVDRKSGQYLVDPEVNARIVAAIREGGVDAWTEEGAAARFLGEGRSPDDFEQVTDILDVWFDSGCTHVFTLESGRWPELRWPADLYLEGSDQHRGWFQSSLLESCGTRGRAPYDAVLTHGFTMDPKGMKMSKSLGNTVDPIKVMEVNGADIIRLWALSVDYTEDHRIGDEILKGVADGYRKLRNTFRYLLGALDGFSDEERIADVSEMPELERYMLSLLATLDSELRRAATEYDFNAYTRALSDFCNNDLSAFFFDIRKDSLYCDAPSDLKRRSYRTVLDILFHALVRYAAPLLVFTAEEVWGTRYPDAGSVHLLEWPEAGDWQDNRLAEIWTGYRALREQVTAEIEPMRRDKAVGSSLEVRVALGFPDDADRPMLSADELAELFIVSEVVLDTGHVVAGPAVVVQRVTYDKCNRCWRLLPEVQANAGLCNRCKEAVGE